MSLDFAEVAEELAPGSALVVFKPNDLATFNSGILDAVEKVAAEARARVAGADISTPAGQALIRSTAYKVAQAKVDLDDLGKKLTEDHKRTAAAVDASRRDMRAKLDAVKEEIRKPLTEFEEAEARRKNDHEDALAMIELLVDFSAEVPTAAVIRERLARLRGLPTRDWQEFKMRAQTAMVNAERELTDKLAVALKAEHEAQIAAQHEQRRLDEEQRKRDEAIAASLRAEFEAVEEANRRRAAHEAELDARFLDDYHAAVLENSGRTVAAELKRVQDAANKAAAERHAAEEATRLANERAEQAAAWAVENERVRVAKEEEEKRVAAERREANKAHRGKINRKARDCLVVALKGVIEPDVARLVVEAIAKGEIPHVTISY